MLNMFRLKQPPFAFRAFLSGLSNSAISCGFKATLKEQHGKRRPLASSADSYDGHARYSGLIHSLWPFVKRRLCGPQSGFLCRGLLLHFCSEDVFLFWGSLLPSVKRILPPVSERSHSIPNFLLHVRAFKPNANSRPQRCEAPLTVFASFHEVSSPLHGVKLCSERLLHSKAFARLTAPLPPTLTKANVQPFDLLVWP